MLRAMLVAVLVTAPLASLAQSDPFYGTKTRTSAEYAGKTAEVLVSNATPTAMPATPLKGRKAVELQNLGPNAIWCAVGGDAPASGKSRKVDPGGTWSLDAGSNIAIRCIASTAAQVTGAATIVTELQ